MGSEIRATTVGELIASGGGSIKTGPFGTVLKAAEYSTNGVPLISVGEVGYGEFRVSADTPRVSPEVTARLPDYVLREGDIVFGRKGAVDRSARIQAHQDGWFLGSDGIRLRLPAGTDSAFIAFQFQRRAIRSWLLQHATGTTMASLNQGIIERIPLLLPSLGEQRAIAEVLGALDDKVDLNHRMNETLEAVTRALFKSWFVDFDPVRTKAEGRPLAGMNAATAALFPSDFETSELGEIPEGWETTPLATAGTWMSGGTPSKSRPEYWGGDLPWVSAKSLNDEVWVHDAEEHVTPLGAQNGTRTVPRGSVLFVVRGMSLASEFRIGLCSREVTFNQDLKAIVPTGRVHPALLTLWLRESRPRILDLADEASHGTKRLQTDALAKLKLVLPPPAVQDRLTAPFDALLERIAANNHEAVTLRSIRDLLLPKLLSGELRVREAERIVECAV